MILTTIFSFIDLVHRIFFKSAEDGTKVSPTEPAVMLVTCCRRIQSGQYHWFSFKQTTEVLFWMQTKWALNGHRGRWQFVTQPKPVSLFEHKQMMHNWRGIFFWFIFSGVILFFKSLSPLDRGCYTFFVSLYFQLRYSI